MPIESFPYGIIDDGNDLSVDLLQKINTNIDVAYANLSARGRGIVDYRKFTTNVNVSSTSLTTPTIISTMTPTLVPGRLYRFTVQLDKIVADGSENNETRQYIAIRIAGAVKRYKYFTTPRTPELQTLYIPTAKSVKFDCIGTLLKVTGSPSVWTCVFTNPGYMYVEDLGDPGGVVLS